MFVVCQRSKMESINKISEHFPLWRWIRAGFSSCKNIIKNNNSDLAAITTNKVRNQKLEVRMILHAGKLHSTFNIQPSTFNLQHFYHSSHITHE
jgi:hypothetical protein